MSTNQKPIDTTAAAELYTALRNMHWNDGKLAVVAAKDLPLGVRTYSGELLDAAIVNATITTKGN